MNEFFKFIFDSNILNNVLKPEWIKLYDPTYIEEELIGGLIKSKDALNDLLTWVTNKALATNITNRSSDENLIPTKKLTTPQPFNLSVPKPKKQPEPVVFDTTVKVNPVPLDLYHKNTLDNLEVKRKQRLEKIKDVLKY